MLLPGDPGRALRLAQQLTEQPRMLNHNRGLWGYTGEAPDGLPLTIQSTGMGGPSAAIVVEELVALGARRLIRVGTCGALDESLALGDLVAVERALAGDGASRALGATGAAEPDPDLTRELARAGARVGTVASADLFYDPEDGRWTGTGALAVEMEAATVLTVARRHGRRAACVVAVSDLVADGERRRIGEEELLAAEQELGRVACCALTAG